MAIVYPGQLLFIIMKRICGLVMACVAIVALCGAGVDKMFVQKHGSDGWLFYVFSQKMPAEKGAGFARNMEYDYTYLECNDSVSLLSTIKTKLSRRPVSAVISFCDSVYTAPCEMIYARPKGNDFVYRIRVALPFPVWDGMYRCERPFSIRYIFADDRSNELECRFAYPAGKWNSNREKMLKIIEAVKFNTGKK